MPLAESSRSGRMSPWAAGAIGAGGGLVAGEAAHYVKATRFRANAALAIGGGLLGLTLSNSGNLQADVTNAQNVAVQMNALSFTTGAGVTGEQVGALRALCVADANNLAKTAYDANPYNLFQSPPTQQTVVSQIASVTAVTTTTTTTSNNLALLLIVGIGIAAVAYSG